MEQKDAIAVFVESNQFIEQSRLKFRIQYPYPTGQWKDAGNNFSNDNRHLSFIDKVLMAVQGFFTQIDTSAYYTLDYLGT